MKRYILLLVLVPSLSWAQTFVPPPSPGGSITTLHPSPGITYQYDNKTTTTIMEGPPGMSWYSQHGPGGTIKQGYLFDPIPTDKPLSVGPRTTDQQTLDKIYGR